MSHWQREPFRLFMPLGLALAWAGVGHWLLHALGWVADYHSIFHAMTQIQGFLTCFAIGFLFTMIPRRTQSSPPAPWQLAVAALGPCVTVLAAWYERWAISQLAWLTTAFVLLGFLVVRLRGSRRAPPRGFVWLPIAFAMGIAGSLMSSAYAFGEEYAWLHTVGRGLVLQGLFLGLVIGAGGLVLPLFTRGVAPADFAGTRDDYAAVAAHTVTAALLVLSFFLEYAAGFTVGIALRFAAVLVALVMGAELWRPPTLPGWHRWLIWLAAWHVPLGYLMALLFPLQHKAGLHVVFIGGFAMLTLGVGMHVILGHGPGMTRPPRWRVVGIGGALAVAMTARALVDFDPARFFLWLGVASAAFLIGSLIWAALLVPIALKRPLPKTHAPL